MEKEFIVSTFSGNNFIHRYEEPTRYKEGYAFNLCQVMARTLHKLREEYVAKKSADEYLPFYLSATTYTDSDDIAIAYQFGNFSRPGSITVGDTIFTDSDISKIEFMLELTLRNARKKITQDKPGLTMSNKKKKMGKKAI